MLHCRLPRQGCRCKFQSGKKCATECGCLHPGTGLQPPLLNSDLQRTQCQLTPRSLCMGKFAPQSSKVMGKIAPELGVLNFSRQVSLATNPPPLRMAVCLRCTMVQNPRAPPTWRCAPGAQWCTTIVHHQHGGVHPVHNGAIWHCAPSAQWRTTILSILSLNSNLNSASFIRLCIQPDSNFPSGQNFAQKGLQPGLMTGSRCLMSSTSNSDSGSDCDSHLGFNSGCTSNSNSKSDSKSGSSLISRSEDPLLSIPDCAPKCQVASRAGALFSPL